MAQDEQVAPSFHESNLAPGQAEIIVGLDIRFCVVRTAHLYPVSVHLEAYRRELVAACIGVHFFPVVLRLRTYVLEQLVDNLVKEALR